MKKLLIVIVFSFFILSACERPPEYPDTPSISINNIVLKEGSSDNYDSLIIYLDFQDGDGDLGLSDDDVYPPYHQFYFFTYNNGQDTLKLGDSDTLPPLSCEDYELFTDEYETTNGTVTTRDTVYVQRNSYYYNFLVDFLVKNDEGEFEEYEFGNDDNWPNSCSSGYYGRFPILNEGLKDKPLEGTIRYGLNSLFRLNLRNDTLKLRFQIIDRALHKSNIVETDEFMVDDIYNE